MKEAVRRRWRALGFVALSVVCAGTAVGYAVHAGARHRAALSAGHVLADAPETVAALVAEPHVMFRNMSVAAQAGFVALAPTAAADGPRRITDFPCRRLDYAAGRGLCLAENGDDPFASPYQVRFFDAAFTTLGHLPLAGLPSRARVSPDGALGAATVFVNGDSYASAGSFSTRTTIFDMAAGVSLGDLETFTVLKDGKRLQGADFNFWGVTFASEPGRFYATLATGGHHYLVGGDLAARTLVVRRDGVECPSLSPDGTRIAYKAQVDGGPSGVKWRLGVLDVATLADHPLAETRNVDDQAEWLDDGTVLYSVESDTYAVPADGTGRPELFAHRADSLVVLPPG